MDNSVFSKSRLDSLKMASKKVAGQRGIPNDNRFAFDAIMQVICKRQWYRTCHATSAMLFMTMKEKGYAPILHLGQCKADSFFDHSWVTLDGNVFDAAIAFNLAEKQYGGSVFDNIDLDTLAEPKMLYQAVFAPAPTSRRAETAADCIRDGVFIDSACGTGDVKVRGSHRL